MGRPNLQIVESLARERWGQLVRNMREQAAHTQRAAAKLGGVSPSIWKGIEAGRSPIEKYIDQVAQACGVSAEELRARAKEIRERVSEELGIVEVTGGEVAAASRAAAVEPRRRRGRPPKVSKVSKVSKAKRKEASKVREATEATAVSGAIELVVDARVGALIGEREAIERLYALWAGYERLDERRRRLVERFLHGGEGAADRRK